VTEQKDYKCVLVKKQSDKKIIYVKRKTKEDDENINYN